MNALSEILMVPTLVSYILIIVLKAKTSGSNFFKVVYRDNSYYLDVLENCPSIWISLGKSLTIKSNEKFTIATTINGKVNEISLTIFEIKPDSFKINQDGENLLISMNECAIAEANGKVIFVENDDVESIIGRISVHSEKEITLEITDKNSA